MKKMVLVFCLSIFTIAFGQDLVSITFQVDMANEEVSADGVHIAGSFQGWSPSATSLSDTVGDGVYSVSVDLTPGDTVEYKYINGNAWGGDEFQGGSNRFLVVPDVDTVLPAYCFNSLFLTPNLQIELPSGIWSKYFT